MITLEEITKIYPLGTGSSVTAVSGVNLEIGQGEFVLVVGRSGSGKTTLLNLAAGLTQPTSGKVAIDGTNLWDLTDQQQASLRSQRIGFIFQFPSLLPTLTVLDNVILPTIFNPKQEAVRTQERATQLLEKVGLSDKLTAYPRQLSAGQQQRVVIARALMNEPLVMLADEPTSNLDEKTELEIMALFRDLHENTGITIVMVTHMRQLVSYGTRAVELANGQLVNGDVTTQG
jgi:putative ABC transport system ATP-binding protein/lipoprotein-releasing system ATP-binding protein